jgi:hypothetical protein
MMGYNLGVCPQCNNVMSMPDDSAVVRCPTCSAEVSAAEAAALAGAANNQGAQQPGNPYGSAIDTTIYTPDPTIGAPLLGTWKTNVLFTVLGVLAAMIVNGFAGGSVDANGEVTSASPMVGIFSLIYVVFCIVYAAKIYPSYFTDKPMISSNEAISFLNTFVGGIIFGLFWNHNLTRREKGIAHIVFIVIIAATFAFALLAAFMIVGGMVASA